MLKILLRNTFDNNDRIMYLSYFNIVSLKNNTLPVHSMETNTAFTAELDDIIRTLGNLDYIKNNEKAFRNRLAIFLGTGYLHWATTYYSHEISHKQPEYNLGSKILGEPDFSNWSLMVPKWEHPSVHYNMDNISEIRGTLNGLNQQEFNADYYFRKSIISDEFDLDDAFSYTFNNLADIAYHTFLREMENGDILQAKSQYYMYLNKNLNLNKWATLSILSGFASFHTIESLQLMLNYLDSGKRSTKPFSANLKGATIYPPNISFHVSPYDYFINTETPLRFSDNILFINLGSTVDDPLQPIRLGLRGYFPLSLKKKRNLTLEPEAFINIDDTGYRGSRIGIRSTLELSDLWTISTLTMIHKGDFVSEDIMGYGITYKQPEYGNSFQPIANRENQLEVDGHRLWLNQARSKRYQNERKANFLLGITLKKTF